MARDREVESFAEHFALLARLKEAAHAGDREAAEFYPAFLAYVAALVAPRVVDASPTLKRAPKFAAVLSAHMPPRV